MKDEMEILNLDDLDVENLERRLELAPTGGPPGGCTTDGCIGYQSCPQNCNADASWRC